MEKQQSKTGQSSPGEADVLLKQLDAEMAMRRAARVRHGDRRASRRTLAILFVLIMVLGLIGGLYYFTVALQERRPAAASQLAPK